MSKLILLNKPFNVLSQFSNGNERETLATYIKIKNVYPAGRLDYDSEGLLILTDDGQVQHFISHPNKKLPKTYYVQVEGSPTQEDIQRLRLGVELKDGMTRPAKANVVDEPDWLWPRNPPIRQRQSIETSWIMLTISEGRNRQVRRMTAAIGFPTLRLIRYSVGNWKLDGLLPGEYRSEEIYLPKKIIKKTNRR